MPAKGLPSCQSAVCKKRVVIIRLQFDHKTDLAGIGAFEDLIQI